jgi:hypothetical protein
VNAGARAAFVLALGSLILYNANVRETSSQDTVPARVIPREVIRSGRLDLDNLFRAWPAGAPLPFYAQRAGEHYRSSYPVAPALLAVPVYALPVLLGAGDTWVVLNALSKLAASLFAALSVAFVYLAARELARRLGTGQASALGAAVVYAAATPTWAVSSQGLWGHAPAQLGLAVALWLLLRGDGGPGRFALAGLGLGLMVASRPSTALVAAVLALSGLPRWRAGGVWVAMALGAVAATVALHNWSTFGSLQGGYALINRTHAQFHGVDGTWSLALPEGLAGLLVSPSRGLLVYSPVLAVAFIGLGRGWAGAGGAPVRPLALAVAASLLTLSTYTVWWGGHSFGPRLLADVLPALVLGIVPAWPVAWRPGMRRWLFGALFAVSVLVEVIGAFNFPSPRHVEWNITPKDVDWAHDRLWDWRDSQLVRLLRNGPVWPGFRDTP